MDPIKSVPLPSSSTVAPDTLKGGSGYLKNKVGELDCYVLVDTGATSFVIHKQLWLLLLKDGVI